MAKSQDSGLTRRELLAAGAAAAGMVAGSPLNALAESAASRPVAQKASTSMPSERARRQILDTAEGRIREHRTGEARLEFVDGDGKPAKGWRGRIRLLRHEFLLGCNAFLIEGIEDAALQRDYAERYAALLNYATLPFYWGFYEPQPGHEEKRERLERMAEFCRRHNILTKGHPLVWHEVFPDWAKPMQDDEVLARLERRVHGIVSHFAGRIDIWDVVNEATVSERFDNAVGRWMKREGAADCVGQALRWAHEANPSARLLYNDFNVWGADFAPGEAYPLLVARLQQTNAPMDALGIQSHMHKQTWPLEKVWETCERYAGFGLPLHWTETTVLSGRPKAPEDNDWHKVHTDWPTTPDGEQAQLRYGRDFYTVLFSHPAVEAVTWWDFSDLHAWQGAPSGLIRKDMSPKPLYEWLMDAFHKRWTTDARVQTDAAGQVTVRCFYGDYEFEGKAESGAAIKGAFTFCRHGPKQVCVGPA
jgi:endo-1,4-beta-xylanase